MGEGAGKRDELLLSGRKRAAALADFFLKAIGERADEVGEVYVLGGFFYVFVVDPVRAQADVAGDGAGEQERVLQDDAEAAAQIGEVHVLDIDAVDSDGAFLHVVEAHEQRDDGGFAGAGVADEGDGFAGLDGEADVAQDPVGCRRESAWHDRTAGGGRPHVSFARVIVRGSVR